MKLLDTSVLIEIDRGNNKEKVEKLDRNGRHAISQVTVTEMFQGVEFQYQHETKEYQEAKKKISRLISRFKVIQIDRDICRQTAKIRSKLKSEGRPVNDLHDTYIAATGIENNLEIITKNPDHFQDIDNLEVKCWENY